VYLSLGSLGSGDVPLMERLVEVLGSTQHRFVVSKGPQHHEYELADNMDGAEFLPQTSLLADVDLVITHGGNNTITEALHFGVPTIVLPLFWDQHDNAQRMDETGCGIRLPTYTFEQDAMSDAIDRLLADRPLAERLEAMSRRLRAAPGNERAAELIARVAETGEPVTR
jgi:UDP:flavonoid glycosyltransferase YjiC (YdhE family)